MWPQICETVAYWSTKSLYEKEEEEKKKMAASGDKTSSSCGFLRPHFQNSFP